MALNLPPDAPRLQDLHAELERALINEYLRGRGFEPASLRDRDDPEAHLLLAEASTYAAGRLTEVEARAHYVHDLHAKD
jgi:phosphoketolase